MNANVAPTSPLPKAPWRVPKSAEKGDIVTDVRGEAMGPLTRMVKFEGKVIAFPAERYVPRPDQPRQDDKEPAAEESKSDVDQIKPIDVASFYWEQRKGIYLLIVDGERRYRKGLEAGLKKIPGRAIWDPSLSRLFETSLIANVAHKSLNPMEEAEAIKRAIDGILERGEAEGEVSARGLLAQRLEKRSQYLYERLQFLEKLGQEQQQLLREGRFRASAAIIMCRDQYSDEESRLKITEALLQAETDDKGRIPSRTINRILADVGQPKKDGRGRRPDSTLGSPSEVQLIRLDRCLKRATASIDSVAENLGNDEMDVAVEPSSDLLVLQLEELIEAAKTLKTALE